MSPMHKNTLWRSGFWYRREDNNSIPLPINYAQTVISQNWPSSLTIGQYTYKKVSYGTTPFQGVEYMAGNSYYYYTYVKVDSTYIGKALKSDYNTNVIEIGDVFSIDDQYLYNGDFHYIADGSFIRVLGVSSEDSNPEYGTTYYKVSFSPNHYAVPVDSNTNFAGLPPKQNITTTLNSNKTAYIINDDPDIVTNLPSYTSYFKNLISFYGASFGKYSHSEGNMTQAIGDFSHSEGSYTKAFNETEHSQGAYNKSHWANEAFGSPNQTLFSIGCGTATNDRKNAIEVMQNGDVYVKGIGDYNGVNIESASTLQSVIAGGSGAKGGTKGGTSENYVKHDGKSQNGFGPISNISVVSEPGNDPNTLYIVI